MKLLFCPAQSRHETTLLPLLAAENVYKEDRLLAFSSKRGGSDLAQIEGEADLKNM